MGALSGVMRGVGALSGVMSGGGGGEHCRDF